MMVRSVVVLPAPLAPMTVVILPGLHLQRYAPQHLHLAVARLEFFDLQNGVHQLFSFSFSAMSGSPR